MGRWYFLTRNTTMKLRMFLMAAATIAAISPAVSNASPEDTAVNACARALASRVATPGSNTPTYRLKYQRGNIDEPRRWYTKQYVFFLQARDAKTGLPLAGATCSTDLRGVVVALTPAPLDASAPALAARF
jgi:hypothetical protein